MSEHHLAAAVEIESGKQPPSGSPANGQKENRHVCQDSQFRSES